ncbi:MAG: hypothetical protein ACOYMS_07040, partial [Terrimicrobiaceae bacterium]
MRFPHLFAALLWACLFSSCATRKPDQPAEAAAVTPREEAKPQKPKSRPALIPIALNPSVEEKSETPTPPSSVTEPTRAEKIIRLVENGGLIQADRNTLVFSRFRRVPEARAGLYEDAIILGRLRRQLKQVRGLPGDVPGSATVHDARAYLVLEDVVGVEPAAGAIDAAL